MEQNNDTATDKLTRSERDHSKASGHLKTATKVTLGIIAIAGAVIGVGAIAFLIMCIDSIAHGFYING